MKTKKYGYATTILLATQANLDTLRKHEQEHSRK